MMTMIPNFHHHATLLLQYSGDCRLLGVTPDLRLYTEETYGEDWFAQYELDLSGARLQSADEHYGENEVRPIPLPANTVQPQPIIHSQSLHFSGPRYRGMREVEKIADMVQPMTVIEKMGVIQHLNLGIPAMMLMGVGESTVLAEAEIAPEQFLVCRRLRLVLALAEIHHDKEGPYDYDSVTLYLAQVYDAKTDTTPPLAESLGTFGGIKLNRPMDCLITQGYLFMADGGTAEATNAIHVWRLA